LLQRGQAEFFEAHRGSYQRTLDSISKDDTHVLNDVMTHFKANLAFASKVIISKVIISKGPPSKKHNTNFEGLLCVFKDI
jgi:hypothetical protein